MKKKAYWNDDFYRIITHDNEKYIQVDGYFYDDGDEGYENPRQTSRCVDYSGLEMPIKDFLVLRNTNENFRDVITDMAANCKQYISDMTPEEAIETMHSYYNGKAPVELTYGGITENTPCGHYVDA